MRKTTVYSKGNRRSNRISANPVDYKGWRKITIFKEIELPNNEVCNHKCCKGIGRIVRVNLGGPKENIKQGIVTHFNNKRIIVELDNSKGEIILTKEMIGSIEIYQDDAEERKMRLSKPNIEMYRPQILISDIKEENPVETVEDFD